MLQLLPTFAALSVALLSGVQAYPFMAFPELLGKDGMKRSLEGVETDFLKRAGVPAVVPFPDNMGLGNEGRPYIFDASLQHVDLVHQYPWKAPGPTDQRGPCAGLNALANHGLISRTGVLTNEDVLFGIGNATGLSSEATAFLHTTTTFFDGDPITGRFSIGGYDSRVSEGGPLAGDLLGKPSGLCGLGHLKSEGDASITRGDFSQPTGENSNCRSYTDFFKELLAMGQQMNPGSGNITPKVLAAHQNARKEFSIANNPNYFSPAFAGVAFTPAAHHFVFALMATKSAEHPEGYMSPEDLMSWFSYTGDPNGDLTYKYGYERIPGASFYKRHPLQQWTLEDIVAAVAQQVAAYPKTSGVGGNTGKVNSFAGIDVGDLSGGAFTSFSQLSDPEKLGCFIQQNLNAESPSFASKLFGPAQQAAIAFIGSTLSPALVKGFGECNVLLGKKGKPMSAYSKTYPGLTAGLNDQSKLKSPAPGS